MSDFYVSTTGNDSNSGAKITPKRTIAAGVALLKAGDSLTVFGGTYIERDGVRVPQSGMAYKRINIIGVGEVIIDGQAGKQSLNSGFPNGPWVGGSNPVQSSSGKQQKYTPLFYITGSYITVENIKVARSIGRGFQVGDGKTRPQGFIARNVTVDVARNAGFLVIGADNPFVENCSVSGAADTISGTATAPGHAGGLTFKGCRNIAIKRGRVFNNWGEGLMIDTNWHESSDWLIQDCEIYNNGWVNIYIHATQRGIVERCMVYQSADWNPEGNLRIGAGLGIHINTIEAQSYNRGGRVFANNITVKNSIIANAGLVFGRGAEREYPNLFQDKIRFVNNVIIKPRGGAITVNATTKNSVFANNIILKGDGPVVQNDNQYKLLERGGNVFNVSPGADLLAASDVIGDPQFFKADIPPTAGSIDPTWYAIMNGSPAIGAGVGLDDVATDYWLDMRGIKPDSGIHEYSGDDLPPVEPPIEPGRVPIVGYMTEESGIITVVFEKTEVEL